MENQKTFYKLKDVPQSKFILALDVNEKGVKKYIPFDSALDIFKFNKNITKKNRVFYEVAQQLNDRKIYFDFDKKINDIDEAIDIEEFKNTFTPILKNVVESISDIEINNSDIIYCNSSTNFKSSFHIILNKYCASVDIIKLVFKLVKKQLDEIDNLKDCLDSAVYGANQCFRLLGSSKLGKNNTKKLNTKNKRLKMV